MSGTLSGLETALWGIITFSLLVIMHEMGHFLAARACGVKVHEFMLGLPGPAVRFKTKNMTWGVTAVPLGGYVRIAGMEPGPEDPLLASALACVRDSGPLNAAALAQALGTSEKHAEQLLLMLEDWKAVTLTSNGVYALTVDGDVEELDPEALFARARAATYRGQSTPRKIAILAMGVVTNLVVAILTFTIVLSMYGFVDATMKIEIVEKGSPAAVAGLQVGDTLVAINGETVSSWDRFRLRIAETTPGDTVTITVERDGVMQNLTATLADNNGQGYLGVAPGSVVVEHPTLRQSLGKSFEYLGLVFQSILDLFNPKTFSTTVSNLSGVVGISVMAAEAVESGPINYAWFIALLSVSLGLMNLIPLPPLDGGKIVLEIVERILGRPLSPSVVSALSTVGALLLFSLVGYVMYADIARLLG